MLGYDQRMQFVFFRNKELIELIHLDIIIVICFNNFESKILWVTNPFSEFFRNRLNF